MTSPADKLAATERELEDKISEIKRLQAECLKKERSWFIILPFSWARTSWDASKADLRAAQEELAALRDIEKILLGQFSSAGKRSASDGQFA